MALIPALFGCGASNSGSGSSSAALQPSNTCKSFLSATREGQERFLRAQAADRDAVETACGYDGEALLSSALSSTKALTTTVAAQPGATDTETTPVEEAPEEQQATVTGFSDDAGAAVPDACTVTLQRVYRKNDFILLDLEYHNNSPTALSIYQTLQSGALRGEVPTSAVTSLGGSNTIEEGSYTIEPLQQLLNDFNPGTSQLEPGGNIGVTLTLPLSLRKSFSLQAVKIVGREPIS